MAVKHLPNGNGGVRRRRFFVHNDHNFTNLERPMLVPPNRTGPLVGLKVLEIGHYIAAPFCTRILADLGAEVIKL